MSVFRTKKVKNFTVMSNNHLKQPDLSFKARGILSTMLAYPDDWEFSIEGLAKMASDGIKSTRSGVNELIEKGFIVRRQERNENGLYIQKLKTDRFSRADQEGKLLFLDDDMMLEALPQTNYLKAIITLEDKIDLEKKGQQSIQGILYLRIMCFSKGNLNALYDRSIGFFRRQLVLSVKRKEPDWVDDPFIAEKLIAEKEGIFLWCLQGLERLLKNNYQFTISEKTKANVENAMIEGNNIIMFMKSKGYIIFDKNCSSKSRDLYRSYAVWCDENLEKPLSERTFTTYLKHNQAEYGIEYIPNLTCKTGKTARGYKGIYCIPITPII